MLEKERIETMGKRTTIYILKAARYIGRTLENFDLFIEAENGVDVLKACKAAARDYVLTDKGLAAYAENGYSLNWDWFDKHVHNKFCKRHGFRKLGYRYSDFQLNMNEELVDPPVVYIQNIEWDADQKEKELLPISCSIPISALELEASSRHTGEDYKKKAVEWLAQRCRHDIQGYEAKII